MKVELLAEASLEYFYMRFQWWQTEILECAPSVCRQMCSYEDLQKMCQQTGGTNRVKNLISQGDRAFGKWIKEQSIMSRNQLKSLKNKVTKEFRKAKKNTNISY